MATRRQREGRPTVISYHREATEAGRAMLEAGGNAFDAFVAATMAEYVVAEGGTSLAGPLGVLIYDAKRRETHHLDAEFNEVRNRRGRWKAGDRPGKAILVPGAPRGLEMLSQGYGKLRFSDCLAPAIRLAREGFPLNDLYHRHIELRAGLLRSSPYGRLTFFRRGMPLQPGEILRQPELATLLERIARWGASYMYRGGWAARFVSTARSCGGLITAGDLARYRPAWRQPWQIMYRGYTLHTCSGRTFGGLWTLLCLKVLEHVKFASRRHFSQSVDTLEILLRTFRQVWGESWLLDYRQLDDRELVEARLTSRYGAHLWKQVRARTSPSVRAAAGSHSYHIIVLDKDGNVASGTNTHESLAWGDGIFVDGVPLPASGYLPWGTRPGERRISPFSMLLAFQGDTLRFATGSFSSSILEASLQFILNLIDYRRSAGEAAVLPRLGTYVHDPVAFLSSAAGDRPNEQLAYPSNWLDTRVSSAVVASLERRGLALTPDSAWRRHVEKHEGARGAHRVPGADTVDTGLGALLAIRPNGRVEGAVVSWPRRTKEVGRSPASRSQARD